MKENTSLPVRKHPTHHVPVERFNLPVVLFVTVRLSDKKHRLVSEESHNALLQAWNDSAHWKVGRYVIMPDHVHMFCAPGVVSPLGIKKWCKFWKGRYRKILNLKTTVWQRDCWDTQIRDLDHYIEKSSYIRMNPIRRKLVEKEKDWLYQGKLRDFQW